MLFIYELVLHLEVLVVEVIVDDILLMVNLVQLILVDDELVELLQWLVVMEVQG